MSTLGLPTDIDELRNFTFDNYQGASMPIGIATAIASGQRPTLLSNMDMYTVDMGNPYVVASNTLGPQIIANMYTSDRVPYF